MQFATVSSSAAAHRAERAETDWWSLPPEAALARVSSRSTGLGETEAATRLREVGRNEPRAARPRTLVRTFVAQLESPLVLLLVFATVLSTSAGEWLDAGVVLAIVVVTAVLGTYRERKADRALSRLRAQVRSHASVLRDGTKRSVPFADVVPGDVVLVSAGSLVPADLRVLEASDLWVSEAILTGESFAIEKSTDAVPARAPLGRRTSMLHAGTNVRSGTGRAVVVATGASTELGHVAERLARPAPETEFDRSLRHFGVLLMVAMLVMALGVFAVHVVDGRPPVTTLLFAVALAVGLSPELLPAILAVNLTRGAEAMAAHGVLVRQLAAIENLGAMDVLCTDKTGTLTTGVVEVEGGYDPSGAQSVEVLELAARNAALETGIESPLDTAILAAHAPALEGLEKAGEVPFDFVRKRVTVGLRSGASLLAVTKGAFHPVLEVCTRVSGGRALDDELRASLAARFDGWAREGIRVIAVATRELGDRAEPVSRTDEHDLVFVGAVTFHDRPKADAPAAVASLRNLGVEVKLLTGDAAAVARHVARAVGISSDGVITGRELDDVPEDALPHVAARARVLAELDPVQKERIVRALRRAGHVVGFLGDGVNDAPAMHAADTSISVEGAVDVAREAADFVLLERDLSVIRRGIEEGRRTFANTMKYVLTTMSANLGNVLSMAVSSLFLPFLPLTAGQILLNNFMSDIPAAGLASDGVDPELVDRPQRWDMRFVARFMVQFGAVSSLFDLLTFGVLLLVFHAETALFQTGWFVESLVTELVIALVVRTRRPFFRSRPGSFLLVSSVVLAIVAFVLPLVPGAASIGFVPLPPGVAAALAGIAALYVVATELLKARFFRAAPQPASTGRFS